MFFAAGVRLNIKINFLLSQYLILCNFVSHLDDYDLILCGRRKTKLEKIKDDLSPKSKIKTLCFDISDKSQVENAYESLSDEWKKIDVLINNAGNAHGLDFIQEGDTNDWDNMIDINVKGLLYLSRHVLKDMVNVNKGHIINLGSIAWI